MQLSGITIYPVKSCAGVDLDRVSLDRFGPVGDRRWLVVDERGRFVSQRDQAHMSLIRVEQVQGERGKIAATADRVFSLAGAACFPTIPANGPPFDSLDYCPIEFAN